MIDFTRSTHNFIGASSFLGPNVPHSIPMKGRFSWFLCLYFSDNSKAISLLGNNGMYRESKVFWFTPIIDLSINEFANTRRVPCIALAWAGAATTRTLGSVLAKMSTSLFSTTRTVYLAPLEAFLTYPVKFNPLDKPCFSVSRNEIQSVASDKSSPDQSLGLKFPFILSISTCHFV